MVMAAWLSQLKSLTRLMRFFANTAGGPLTGKSVVITAGPTHEPLDPVRYIANRSSGKQGYALAVALRDLGAKVTLVSGPTGLAFPRGSRFIRLRPRVR